MTSPDSDADAKPQDDAAVWMPAGVVTEGSPPVAEQPTPDAWRVDPSAAPTAHTELAAPRRREPRRWIGLALGLLVVAGAGGAVYLLQDDAAQAPDKPGQSLDSNRQATSPPSDDRVRGALQELTGIPQVGSILGKDGDLPVLTVFADISSRGFARFDAEVLPALLSGYVRPGRVKIQLRTLPGKTTVGGEAARTAQAAGLQTRFWELVRALSSLNRGSLDADDVAAAGRAVPGLDPERLAADRRSSRVQDAIARASRLAPAGLARSGPAFTITDGDRTEDFAAPLSSRRFSVALQEALERLDTS